MMTLTMTEADDEVIPAARNIDIINIQHSQAKHDPPASTTRLYRLCRHRQILDLMQEKISAGLKTEKRPDAFGLG